MRRWTSVQGAWQDTHLPEDRRREKVLAECADVIQATLNLVAAIGVEDFRPYMKACERLQGFPDDWTKVPYRGKSADECPDTPRYKAIGNSMAVPVMRWLGKRIEMVEGETR